MGGTYPPPGLPPVFIPGMPGMFPPMDATGGMPPGGMMMIPPMPGMSGMPPPMMFNPLANLGALTNFGPAPGMGGSVCAPPQLGREEASSAPPRPPPLPENQVMRYCSFLCWWQLQPPPPPVDPQYEVIDILKSRDQCALWMFVVLWWTFSAFTPLVSKCQQKICWADLCGMWYTPVIHASTHSPLPGHRYDAATSFQKGSSSGW